MTANGGRDHSEELWGVFPCPLLPRALNDVVIPIVALHSKTWQRDAEAVAQSI